MVGPTPGRSPGNTTDQISKLGEDLGELPIIHLSSGVNRGLAKVPVFQIDRKARLVEIRLNLAFAVAGTVREALLDSAGTSIWTQQFSTSYSSAPHGITTIILPAALFTSDDYRLRVQAGSGEDSASRVECLFRIVRN
jgi:hypothetical protein